MSIRHSIILPSVYAEGEDTNASFDRIQREVDLEFQLKQERAENEKIRRTLADQISASQRLHNERQIERTLLTHPKLNPKAVAQVNSNSILHFVHARMKSLWLALFLYVLAPVFTLTCSAQALVNGTQPSQFDGIPVTAGMKLNGIPLTPPGGGSGSTPAYVSSGGDFSGSGSVTTTSVTAGNHLVIWTVAADTTTGHTCTATGNTIVNDVPNISTSGRSIIGNMMHIKSIASTGFLTVTCSGSTPLVAWLQYSGGIGDFDAASSLVDCAACASPFTPPALTTMSAADILVDGYANLDSAKGTITEADSAYTLDSSAVDGSSSFVGAIGHRIVGSAGSYSDGWTLTTYTADSAAVNSAYK